MHARRATRGERGRPQRAAAARAAIAALLLAAALGGNACRGGAEARKTADPNGLSVNVLEVQPLELRREVEAIGTLTARDQAVVSAEVAGRVARLAADLGDKVKAGAPLVILDAQRLQYRADEQNAALQQMRARLGAKGDQLPPAEQTPDILSAAAKKAEAEQALARTKRLANEKLVPPDELERAETQVQTANAAHEAAIVAEREMRAQLLAREATLGQATRDLHDATIRAPFDGVVAERLVSEGQFVAAQAPAMRLVRLDPLRLTAEIPEQFAPGIRTGQVISVRTDAYPDSPVQGTVTRIAPDVKPSSRTFAIEAEVPNPDGALKPGVFARIKIATTKVDTALVVPVSAIQTRYGTSLVFIVRDNTLNASEVKLGDRIGTRVEIRDGLQAGATIVVDGVEGLTAGQKVVPKKAADKGEKADSGGKSGGDKAGAPVKAGTPPVDPTKGTR